MAATTLVVNPEALKALRVRTGLSLRDLAEASGIAYSYIREIEAGAKQPSEHVILALAAGLRVPVTAITRDSVA